MSFIARAAKAATTARTQLAEVRELRAQTAVRAAAPAALTDQEERLLFRARQLGAPDPYLLLTAEEAAMAAGQVLGGPALTYGDDTIGVRFTASAPGNRHWSAAVSAFHAPDDDTAFDAAAHWFGFLADAVADGGTAVPGLGDAAIARDGEVFVLADPVLLMVEVATPQDGDAARAVTLARTVVARLFA